MTAPVREVNIEKAENRITCSSEGIYPEPLLTWSTSRQTVFRSTTIVQQSGPNRELYNIKSSVIFPDTKHDFTDMTYSCTVTTRSNNKTAILSNRNLKEGKCVLRFVVSQSDFYQPNKKNVLQKSSEFFINKIHIIVIYSYLY